MFESFLKKFSRKSRTFYPPTAKHLNKFYNHTRGHQKNFAPILHTHSAIYSRQTSSAICNTYFPRAFHKPKKKKAKNQGKTQTFVVTAATAALTYLCQCFVLVVGGSPGHLRPAATPLNVRARPLVACRAHLRYL